jgi:transposase
VNQTYQDLAEHYNVAVMPARPHKPRDKAKVEKAVQEVERQVLAPLRHQSFTSFSGLNQAIRPLLESLNGRTMRDYGQSRRSLFETVDQPALKPLPQHPFSLATWKQAKVNLDYHIEVEHHYYSVPYQFVRHEVRVKVSESLVEVFHDAQRIAMHERSRVCYRHSTKPEHMPPAHWAYKTQSQQQFLAWAGQIGPYTTQQVQAILAQKDYEEQAFRSLRGVQQLATTYGAARLEAACRYAQVFGLVGLRRLRSLLQTNLDQAPLPETDTPHVIPGTHDNVRGQPYYH